MGILSNFALGLAVNIVHDFIKSKIEPGLKKDIENALEESLKEWSINETIRIDKKSYLKEHLEKQFQFGNEYYKSVDGEVQNFLTIFNEKICSHPIAYRYFNDIKTEAQYDQLKSSFDRVEKGITSLRKSNEAILHELKDNAPVLKEWGNQLEAYYKLLDDLKPKTALQLISALEKRIKENKLDALQSIQSRIYFLKGTCLEIIKGEIENSYLEFIKAYELSPDVFVYQEKACFCYYRIGEISKSTELALNILSIDSYNVIANATKLLLNLSEFDSKINEISLVIKKEFDFKRILYISINKNKESLITLFPEMVLNGQPLELFELNYQNLKRNSYVVDLAINRFMREFRIEWIRNKESDNEILKITKNILKPFVNQIKGKEIGGYTEVIFFNAYLDFLIEQNEDLLPLLSSYYQDTPSPKNEYFGLILANCHQQKDRDSDAIKILDNIEPTSQNALNLKLYCANKIEDKEILFETVNQKISLYENIGINEFEDILRSLRLLNEFNVLSRFQLENFKQKVCQSPDVYEFINLYYRILLNPEKKESPEAINGLKDSFAQNNKWILSYFVEVYFKTENYAECISSFEDQTSESRTPYDINYYIFALYRIGTQNLKLLEWLKHWRDNLGYDSRFTRIELDKRAIINDWKGCLEICSLGIENELHEDYLLHYAIATYHLNDKEASNLQKELF